MLSFHNTYPWFCTKRNVQTSRMCSTCSSRCILRNSRCILRNSSSFHPTAVDEVSCSSSERLCGGAGFGRASLAPLRRGLSQLSVCLLGLVATGRKRGPTCRCDEDGWHAPSSVKIAIVLHEHSCLIYNDVNPSSIAAAYPSPTRRVNKSIMKIKRIDSMI